MNAQSKVHQANIALWTARLMEQAQSGLLVKDWCKKENIKPHVYYYWKRLIKESAVDRVLPDIVPIHQSSSPVLISDLPADPAQTSSDSHELCNSYHSHKSYNFYNSHNLCNSAASCITVSIGDIKIEVPASVPDDRLLGIIKAIRYV